MRVTGVAAARGGDRLKARPIAGVTLVVDERPCTIERGRPEISCIPSDRIARGVTDAAIDAFNGGIGGQAGAAVGPDLRDRIVAGFGGHERAFRLLPFLEEQAHVGCQILDHRQVRKRRDFDAARARDFRDMGAAGPARQPIDRHGARPADTHAASKTVGKGRIEVPLHERNHIEYGLVLAQRHLIILVMALLRAAPNCHAQFFVGHRITFSFSFGCSGTRDTEVASPWRGNKAFALSTHARIWHKASKLPEPEKMMSCISGAPRCRFTPVLRDRRSLIAGAVVTTLAASPAFSSGVEDFYKG